MTSNVVTPAKKSPQKKKSNAAAELNSVGYSDTADDDDVDVLIESEKCETGSPSPNNPVFIKMTTKKFNNTPKSSTPPQSTGTKKKNNPVPVKPVPKGKKEVEMERTCTKILQGNKVMVLLRGLPGSGKSHMARALHQCTVGIGPQDPRNHPANFIFSTDDFFFRNGKYVFNHILLQDAHAWNQRRVFEAGERGLSPIIVDNTNTQAWEMRPYAMTAVQFGYQLEVLEPDTPWAWHVPELTRRSLHQVPKQRISEMVQRYERNINGDKLMALYCLQYPPGRCPPQPRTYPPLALMHMPFLQPPPRMPIQPLLQTPLLKQMQMPPLIQVPPPLKVVQPPKVKKQRQRKPRSKQQQQQSDGSQVIRDVSSNGGAQDTASNSGSLYSQEQNLSDTWDSDTDGTWEELNPEQQHKPNPPQDLLSTSMPDDMEYVLVNSDHSLVYQKKHETLLSPTNTATVTVANQVPQQHDLINFMDIEEPRDVSVSTDNLIQLDTSEQITNTNTTGGNIELADVRAGLQSITVQDKPFAATADNNKQAFVFPKLDFGSLNLPDSWKNLFSTTKSAQMQPNRKYSSELFNEMDLKEAATNTFSSDFVHIGKDQSGVNMKILFGKVRDINDVTFPKQIMPPPRILMLHKSTMTGIENIMSMQNATECSNKNAHLSNLLSLFPQVEKDVLQDIFDKCKGDVNWAVDLLLESSGGALELDPLRTATSEQQTTTEATSRQCDHDEGCTCTAQYELRPFDEPMPPAINPQPESTSTNNDTSLLKQAKIKNKPTDDPIKKHIEEQFKIGDQHYSQHLLSLRRKRHGETEPETSTSVAENATNVVETESEETGDSSEEEIMELNLGQELVSQLEKQFGFGAENVAGGRTDYPRGFQPVVQLPATLARQLHSLWLESVYTQMRAQTNVLEEMERQDKELALLLQQQESALAHGIVVPVPDLQEIMDMEIALAVYRADQEQWKRETPQDLASRMTRQKLYEAFPNLEKDLLTEILQAHDNNFEQTVNSLMCSVGRQDHDKLMNVNGRILPKNGTEQIAKQRELLENAKKEPPKLEPFNSAIKVSVDDDDDIDEQGNPVKRTANYYREQAAHHLEMRQETFRKAQQCVQRGLPQVASYYSEVAKLHMQKYEIANNRAACAFLTEHSSSGGGGAAAERTLDLHYLYVREAEQALAMFIDAQISKLQHANKFQETLFVITGRGNRSAGGISQIKPAVKRRLKQRNLGYKELNPGLLNVTITKNSLLTNDLKSA